MNGLGVFYPLVEISWDPSIFSEGFLPSAMAGIPQEQIPCDWTSPANKNSVSSWIEEEFRVGEEIHGPTLLRLTVGCMCVQLKLVVWEGVVIEGLLAFILKEAVRTFWWPVSLRVHNCFEPEHIFETFHSHVSVWNFRDLKKLAEFLKEKANVPGVPPKKRP